MDGAVPGSTEVLRRPPPRLMPHDVRRSALGDLLASETGGVDSVCAEGSLC